MPSLVTIFLISLILPYNLINFVSKTLMLENKEIRTVLPILIKEVDLLAKKDNKLSFENLLKLAMNYLDNDSSNLAI